MTANDIPFYTECSFGYYEWFVKIVNNVIVIKRIATLASFKRIISDKDYLIDIKYSPQLKDKDKYVGRNDAYEYVRKYWDNKRMRDYVKINFHDREVIAYV